MKKEIKVFISHSEKDKKYAEVIVRFLTEIGVTSEHIFCSSVPPHGVKISKNFIQEIFEQYQKYDLKMIYLLSSNFYGSPVSLNEMGAAWIKGYDYYSVLLPGFDFSDIYGVIDSKAIAIKMDDEKTKIRAGLDDLKADICNYLNIPEPAEWEQIKNNCIDDIERVKRETGRKPAVIMSSPI